MLFGNLVRFGEMGETKTFSAPPHMIWNSEISFYQYLPTLSRIAIFFPHNITFFSLPQACKRMTKCCMSKPNIEFNTFWRPVLSIRKISESPPIKPSSIYDSGSGIVLKAKESLQLTQSMPSIPHEITKFCWLHVARWEYHIHIDSTSVQCWNIITDSFFFLLIIAEVNLQ